ncbi:hypothetical protein ACLOJK_030660 [Asimina triloba]
MTGVWVFDGGVMRPSSPSSPAGKGQSSKAPRRRKVLVYTPTTEVITSYTLLEQKLTTLGWERYYDNPNFIQFHKQSSIDLISLPPDFSKFTSVYMYDIVLKNPNKFEVKDM